LNWLRTTSGQRFLTDEGQRLALDLDDVFGQQLLILGDWANPATIGEVARTSRVHSIGLRPGKSCSAIGMGECLPVQSDSVDAVLAPHTLEMAQDPHGVLREINRVLRPEGAVIITGFRSLSRWGMRRALSRGQFPPGCRQIIPERRVCDWLRLLGYRLDTACYFDFAAPLAWRRSPTGHSDDGAGSARFPHWRVLAGAYSLKARKQVVSMTPQKPAWRRRPRLVAAGLVNPTTRNAA
jgi:SAM-dependent methyltransferase